MAALVYAMEILYIPSLSRVPVLRHAPEPCAQCAEKDIGMNDNCAVLHNVT